MWDFPFGRLRATGLGKFILVWEHSSSRLLKKTHSFVALDCLAPIYWLSTSPLGLS
jgi:hypothetical protein